MVSTIGNPLPPFVMRNLFFLLLVISFTGCSYLESGNFQGSVTITGFENTAEGTVVRFTIDSDGEPLTTAGAAYGYDSIFNIARNQFLATETGGNEYEVIVEGADDGLRYFQAFAAFDGFYALSEIVPFEVVSAVSPAPCEPGRNYLNAHGYTCGPGQTNVSTRAEEYNFQITGNCGTSTQLKLKFHRDPTSGIYRTVSSLDPASSSRAKEVVATIQIQNQFKYLKTWQEIYVAREGDETVVTLCDLEFPYGSFTAKITAQLAYER